MNAVRAARPVFDARRTRKHEKNSDGRMIEVSILKSSP